MRKLLALAAILFVALMPSLSFAVEPGEMLKDPKLEARARALSTQLRCLVCQNELIDDSQAQLAHDLRVLIRQRIMEGQSDKQILDFLVSRYGDFILLKPPLKPETLLLWGTPISDFDLRRRRDPFVAAPPRAGAKAGIIECGGSRKTRGNCGEGRGVRQGRCNASLTPPAPPRSPRPWLSPLRTTAAR